MQELHLTDHYRDGENIRVNVKMLLALSFVPSIDITNAFEILVESCPGIIDPVRLLGRQLHSKTRTEPQSSDNRDTFDYLRGIAHNLTNLM